MLPADPARADFVSGSDRAGPRRCNPNHSRISTGYPQDGGPGGRRSWPPGAPFQGRRLRGRRGHARLLLPGGRLKRLFLTVTDNLPACHAMRRTGRLLSPVLIVGTLFAVTATAAQAATVISAPTITAPLGGLGRTRSALPSRPTGSPISRPRQPPRCRSARRRSCPDRAPNAKRRTPNAECRSHTTTSSFCIFLRGSDAGGENSDKLFDFT